MSKDKRQYRIVLAVEGAGDVEGALEEFTRMFDKAGGFETGAGEITGMTVTEVEDVTGVSERIDRSG